MEVTLKKAADLSRAALDAAKGVSIKTTVNVSIYGSKSAAEAVAAARESVTSGIETVKSLLTVGYEIRAQIGAKNAEVGIDDKLTEQKHLDALESRLTALLGGKATDRYGDESEEDIEAVQGQIDAMKASTEHRYSNHVSANVIDATLAGSIQADIAAIKRKKADNRDTLAGLNLTTKIVLSDLAVKVLRDHNILA